MSATESNKLPLWVQDRDKVIEQSTDVEWRYGERPDYSRSKENLAQESLYNHLNGSVEAIVQNLVRTFEMEVSFKSNPQQWLSIVNDKFRVSTNGGPEYTAADLSAQGTYNLFMADSEHYKASAETFESSGKLFHTCFPKGFPWEVLEVYSGPPNVTFKWRHWGTFSGPYKDYTPTGERVEIIGMSVARVTEDLKILAVEHYFDNTLFLEKLTAGGKQGTGDKRSSFWGFLKRFWNREQQQASLCPFSALLK
ncbi:ester cyclase [Aetokthonos hydrillicola Thurmond2011]|uniref:Ester cyclase n=1 Tax=Aetokthonos hydrillicola Thurmond2011 TaxID=2712845 RepID=A0AAP5M7J8_9CYAN|nr:SnoaL-like polyketide cyclase [Aetokthonos hydrillicola]MBO3457499.1 ester cyclase [Aetokthonos hydrillicola CCALA 1050]MBW4585978.1 ester cyclase [Aetokthonos hydrillicola CCALA 1050]MDR9893792.1 ester cyclase [Aetokthonos hydrillicola Thurmond2011]